MNYYVLLPLTAFTINTFTWTYIFSQKRQTAVNKAYLILAADLAFWSLGGFFVWSPIQEFLLLPIWKLYSTIWLASGPCFLNFSYTFTKTKKCFLYYMFLVFSFISIIISQYTNLFINGYVKHYWGTSQNPGILFVPIILISVIIPIAYSLFLIYKKMKESDDIYIKRQLRLISDGTILVILFGLTFDVVLPYFGINHFLRFSTVGTITWTLFIFISVTKYNFLSIDVEEAANDLFINVVDGIVLVNKNEYIMQANESAKELFHLHDFEYQDLKISDLFENYDFKENYKNYETKTRTGKNQRIVSLSQSTVKQNNVELGKILIVRDITEKKEAEKELQDGKIKLENLARELAQANASLEQKVAARTRSLQQLNEQSQREIIERRRAEEELAAEKERLAVTLGSIGDGVITTNTRGQIVSLNTVAENLTGWSQAEASGQPLQTVFRVMDEKTRGPCANPVEEVLHLNNIVSRTHPTILIARDATERIIAESAAPIRDKTGKVFGVVLVFRDTTERRKIEEELIKADKLESVGVLAGGIAHDFNNILTAILGNISLAKMYANAEDKVFPKLANAEKAALQAQNLTQQLLMFSKGGSLIRKPASIGDLIRDCIDFSLRGSNVKCECFIEENVWPVEVDEGQINQVINNLIINADQSMPEGGVIELRTENVFIDEENIELLKPGRYVRISVKDHGLGIPEEHIQKIFDPYFTTKKKGSGLGLFTCYSIVKKHDGHLAVDSREGVGTTFYVYLPASERRMRKAAPRQEVQYAGKGKILVMEDDETIRDVTGEMLGHFGYDVAFAQNGTEAIDLYTREKEAGTPFDVIIMDLTIPGGMGGKETISKILEIDPQAKAIVASGYTNDPIMAEFTQYGFRNRIVKPYKAGELHEILHSVIIDNQP
jgi:PAS domain S-box-containing protein